MLTPGARVGPYEVQALIGQGGMGEVYRRRTRGSITRNICAVHDVGRVGDTDYLVLEHLQGETLAQRVQRGALPVSEALRVAFQIADALDAAHRQHIVHRDLKPGNVMLTKSGVKLLDFGVAKPVGFLTAAAGVTRAETATAPITSEGTILGTLQYMAPEQLEGRDSDARTDVFAFGTVLYEMITGRPALAMAWWRPAAPAVRAATGPVIRFEVANRARTRRRLVWCRPSACRLTAPRWSTSASATASSACTCGGSATTAARRCRAPRARPPSMWLRMAGRRRFRSSPANSLLRRVSLDLGVPVTLALGGFAGARGLAWDDDGHLLFARDLVVIQNSDGASTPLPVQITLNWLDSLGTSR